MSLRRFFRCGSNGCLVAIEVVSVRRNGSKRKAFSAMFGVWEIWIEGIDAGD